MASTDRYQILEDEPSARLPVCILVDKSYSMRVVSGGERTGETVSRDGRSWHLVKGGTPSRMDQLLDGYQGFVDNILCDLQAKASVEMAVVSFGDEVKIERDFNAVTPSMKSMKIAAMGDGTRLGQAVKTALDLLDRRRSEYEDYYISSYKPQLVILTDGQATDPELCAQQGRIVQQRMNDRKLICLPFLIGNERKTDTLMNFAPKGNLLRIDGVDLARLFKYLSDSAIRVSRSTAGGADDLTIDRMLEELKRDIVPVGQI